MDKDLIIWLYEKKDAIEHKLHVDHVEGTYRQELWAKINLLDEIISVELIKENAVILSYDDITIKAV